MKATTAILFIALLLPTMSSAAVYRCNVGGQVVFTDQPCSQGAPSYMEGSKNAPLEYSNRNTPAETSRQSTKDLSQVEARYFVMHDEIIRLERQYKSLDNEYQREIKIIQEKQKRSANNLAGATWDISLANEMQAVTARYTPRLERMNTEIDKKKSERDTLKDEIDSMKGLR